MQQNIAMSVQTQLLLRGGEEGAGICVSSVVWGFVYNSTFKSTHTAEILGKFHWGALNWIMVK
jgi:hypothetical protein